MGVENLQSIDSIPRVAGRPVGRRAGRRWAVVRLRGSGGAGRRLLFALPAAGSKRSTITLLAVCRAVLLMLMLFMILAEPVLKLEFTSRPRPVLWVLFDGTESMDIQDEMTESQRSAGRGGWADERLFDRSAPNARNTTDNAEPSDDAPNPSLHRAARRRPQPREWTTSRRWSDEAGRATCSTGSEKNFRVEAFILDRPDGVREIEPADRREPTRSASGSPSS